MDGIWGMVAQIGIFFLNSFIGDLIERARLKASWQAFIANRQQRANDTIQLKDNLDEQDADLERIKAELQNPKPEEKKDGSPNP